MKISTTSTVSNSHQRKITFARTKTSVTELIHEFKHIFTTDNAKLTPIKCEGYKIPMLDTTPVYTPEYVHGPEERGIIQEFTHIQLEYNVIEPSNSAWRSPLFLERVLRSDVFYNSSKRNIARVFVRISKNAAKNSTNYWTTIGRLGVDVTRDGTFLAELQAIGTDPAKRKKEAPRTTSS